MSSRTTGSGSTPCGSDRTEAEPGRELAPLPWEGVIFQQLVRQPRLAVQALDDSATPHCRVVGPMLARGTPRLDRPLALKPLACSPRSELGCPLAPWRAAALAGSCTRLAGSCIRPSDETPFPRSLARWCAVQSRVGYATARQMPPTIQIAYAPSGIGPPPRPAPRTPIAKRMPPTTPRACLPGLRCCESAVTL